jgi:ATP-binding cassette subfamily B protein
MSGGRKRAGDWKVAARLIRFAAPHRALVGASVALLAVMSVGALAAPWALKNAVDRGIARGSLADLRLWSLVFFGIAIAESLLEYLKTQLNLLTGQRVIYDLRERLFRHIHALPLRFFDRTPVGALVTRATSDVDALAEMFSSGVAALFHDLLRLLIVVVVLFVVDARLATLSLAMLPVVIVFSILFSRRMREAFRVVRSRISSLNGFQQEAISGVSVTRLFRRERTMEERFDGENLALRDANYAAIFNFALFWPIVEALSALGMSAILVYGGMLIDGGELTWGKFFFFSAALAIFFEPIRELSDKFNILQSALAAADRIFSILDEPPEPPDLPSSAAPARSRGEVEFRDVHFFYKDGAPVLHGISFRANPGETIALVGPTGAGKTSIISLVSRLWDATSGQVLVDGTDVREWDRRALRSRIAVVMQDVFLFQGTLFENVALGNPRLTEADVKRACETVNAAGFVERLPGGYHAEIRERGGNLSV